MYIRLIRHIYCFCCGVWLRCSGPTFVTAQTQSSSAFTSSAAGKWSRALIGSERLWHLLPYWLSPAIDVFPLMKQELMSGLRNGPLSPCLFFFFFSFFFIATYLKGAADWASTVSRFSRNGLYAYGRVSIWHELYVLMSLTPRGIEINFSIWLQTGEKGQKERNWNLILFVNVLSSGKERKKKLLNENMPRNIRMMVLVLLKIAQGSGRPGFLCLSGTFALFMRAIGATGLRDWAKSGGVPPIVRRPRHPLPYATAPASV